jgi:hypothetical protein
MGCVVSRLHYHSLVDHCEGQEQVEILNNDNALIGYLCLFSNTFYLQGKAHTIVRIIRTMIDNRDAWVLALEKKSENYHYVIIRGRRLYLFFTKSKMEKKGYCSDYYEVFLEKKHLRNCKKYRIMIDGSYDESGSLTDK